MIILSKKRIIKLLTIVTVCLTVCFVQDIGNDNDDTVSTVTLPVTNKVIVVDAGHGVPDERDKMLKLKAKPQKYQYVENNNENNYSTEI